MFNTEIYIHRVYSPMGIHISGNLVLPCPALFCLAVLFCHVLPCSAFSYLVLPYCALFCLFLDVKFVATSHIGNYLNIKVQLSFTRPRVKGLSKIMPLLSWDSKLYVCLLGGQALVLGGTLQRCTTVC